MRKAGDIEPAIFSALRFRLDENEERRKRSPRERFGFESLPLRQPYSQAAEIKRLNNTSRLYPPIYPPNAVWST